jgi:ATP-binding cassette, subfamily B, vacuolar membrane transporter HMT1/ACLQ
MDALEIGAVWHSVVESVYFSAQVLYPVILLVAFIVSGAVHSVVTARSEEELVVPTATGPGGKPLPVTKRKREQLDEPRAPDAHDGGSFARGAFRYATAAVVLTFFANGAAIAVHALQARGKSGQVGNWWCGEERTVSLPPVFGLPIPSERRY